MMKKDYTLFHNKYILKWAYKISLYLIPLPKYLYLIPIRFGDIMPYNWRVLHRPKLFVIFFKGYVPPNQLQHDPETGFIQNVSSVAYASTTQQQYVSVPYFQNPMDAQNPALSQFRLPKPVPQYKAPTSISMPRPLPRTTGIIEDGKCPRCRTDFMFCDPHMVSCGMSICQTCAMKNEMCIKCNHLHSMSWPNTLAKNLLGRLQNLGVGQPSAQIAQPVDFQVNANRILSI